MPELKPLILNLTREYWEEIRDGKKPFEFRLITPYWSKRLIGKTFSHVECRLGYPKSTDHSRILKREWRGYVMMEILHKHFGLQIVDVFSIDVSKAVK